MTNKRNDLVNQRFGRLVALHIDPSPSRATKWVCRCDCGTVISAMRCNLMSGGTTSCHCSKRTHGHSKKGVASITMRSWSSMIQRCTNPGSPSFKHYNGRGITVCERWQFGQDGLSGFSCFLADVGERPSLDLTLERIDNDKGYYPGNCKWATRAEQFRNRTTTRLFLHEGKQKTIEELAAETGLSTDSLRWRLIRKKMPIEQALSVQVQKGIRFTRDVPLVLVEFEGEMLTLRQISERTGLSVPTIRGRYRHGKPLVQP